MCEFSMADWALKPWHGNQSRRKIKFKPVKLQLKLDLVTHPANAEGLGKYM